MSPDPNFWRGRKTLITGHTGFKGGWLALWLHKLGAQITGIALPASTSPSLYDTAKVKSIVEEAVGDIRNADFLMDKTRSAEPEIIFHLAAQPLVRASYDDPLATFETNVMGTLNVLEAARGAPSVKAIVNVTSDKCYENHEWHWAYRETDQGILPDPSPRQSLTLQEIRFRQSMTWRVCRCIWLQRAIRSSESVRGASAQRAVPLESQLASYIAATTVIFQGSPIWRGGIRCLCSWR